MGKAARADIERLIGECGFDGSGQCASSCLQVRSEVRDMCAAGRCGQYGRNWACPPACGTLDEYERLMATYESCYAVQTVATLEDEFDVEGMMAAERVHKERVFALSGALRASGADALVLSSGTCTVCPTCSYPAAPCRFPDKRLVSMEAAGLVVSDVCTACGIAYNHGKNTIAYTSCALV